MRLDVDDALEREDANRRRAQTREANLAQPDRDWITTQQAAAILCVSVHTLRDYATLVPLTIRCRGKGTAHGVGRLWLRSEIDAVGRIKSCGPSLKHSLLVYAGFKDGRIWI